MEKINRYFYGSEHGERFQILRRREPSLGSACDVVFKGTDEVTREEVEACAKALNDKIGWKDYDDRKGERREPNRPLRFMKMWNTLTGRIYVWDKRKRREVVYGTDDYLEILNRGDERRGERRVRRGGSKHDRKA